PDSRREGAEQPRPEPPWDANRWATLSRPQPGRAEVRSRGTRKARLTGRVAGLEGRRGLVSPTMVASLLAVPSGARSPRAPFLHTQPMNWRRTDSRLRSCHRLVPRADCSPREAEPLAPADTRIPAVPTYLRDRVAQSETRAGRWI